MNSTRYRHMSQCQFQLDAITKELHTALEQNSLLCTDRPPNAEFTLTQTTSSVRVGVNQSIASPILEFAPLFPGSFTQQDVTVNAIHCPGVLTSSDVTSLENVRAGNHSAGSVSRLNALSPILHFARFNSLPEKLATSIHQGRKPISIVIDESATTSTTTRERLKHRLETIVGEFGTDHDVVVIQLNINAQSYKGWPLKRLSTADFRVPEGVCIHSIVVNRPEVMMALLAKSTIALVPSISLAIDAVNAGCPYCIYGEQQLADTLLQHIEYTSLGSSRFIQEEQRKMLAQYQIGNAESQRLVANKDQMWLVLSQWITAHTGNRDSSLKTVKQTQAFDAIIPVNSAPTRAVRKRLTSAQSKFRKLRHSPRQFLQDSNIRSLRRLSSLVR